ncbi:2-alkenal reductase [Anaeromyxobacter dehalogenans 2CP-1]|uniref:Chaperone protein DnaK n=1 Tax=Anaeromyxobacter dehalogenans (strain ATCC BAA-258 / DSM 21875 / 2CP-1) TaxID=455488 RepID=B8JER6_ANAD2|nr:molecular chaperone DnaK [Anaeromyxobacter dehalogenans]ACL66212.1 2-alkenal reductase [Anaeromyxobacter dehalogenans 2CP-1]
MSASEPVIGIDLGTTNSVVATVQDGVPRVIPGRSGQLLTPSVVAFARNGKRLVGALAKRQAITNAEDTVFAAKRLIGRRWGSKEIEDARQVLPYRLVAGPEGHDVRVELGGRTLTVQEISAMVLAELRADAEAWLGQPVSRAVITVPAYFNDGQRHATKDAGRIAGLEVLRIINEPTSAALAYGFGKQIERKVVVFDLGGGTFDVSVLDIGKSVYDVVAVGGDTYLGGEDFDRRVMDWLTFGFAKENGGIDLRQDKMALQRLRDAAERAKCELSSLPSTALHLPFLVGGGEGKGALHLDRQLSREKLEELTKDLVDRCIAVTERTLRDAGVRPSQVGEVLLVGGMTRMPWVQQAVREFFGREPCRGVHPEEVVALGAAIQAQALSTPHAGAEMLLLDVTPQNLGLMVVGGYFQTVIPRNTTVPTSQTHLFTTVQDDQTSVRIAVLQGESERAIDNELLGEFVLDGIRPARRGEVEIEVTFEISADGIVGVSARDVATGLQQSISVTATSGLTEDEMRHILDEQIDELLERKQTAREFETRRDRVLALVREIEALGPEVHDALERTRFGKDAVLKAEGVLARARTAVEARDLAALAAEEEPLERTLQLFKGLAATARPGTR